MNLEEQSQTESEKKIVVGNGVDAVLLAIYLFGFKAIFPRFELFSEAS